VGAIVGGNLALTGTAHSVTVADGAAVVDLEIAAALSGPAAASLTKLGAGVLQFSGSVANSFAGATTVAAGSLEANEGAGAIAVAGPLTIAGGTFTELQSDQIADASPVAVNAGGTFDLNGQSDTVGDFRVNGGIVLTNGGRLTANNTSFDANSTLNMVLVDSAASDRTTVNGSVTLGGVLQLVSGVMIPTGTQITLIDNDAADPIIGFFSNAPEGSSLNVNGTTFQITYM